MIQFNADWVENHVYDVNAFLIGAQDSMQRCFASYYDSYNGTNEKASLSQDLQGIINLFAPIIQMRIDLLDLEIRKQVAISYFEDSGNFAPIRPKNEPMELIVLGMQMYAQSYLVSYDNVTNLLETEIQKYAT